MINFPALAGLSLPRLVLAGHGLLWAAFARDGRPRLALAGNACLENPKALFIELALFLNLALFLELRKKLYF